MRRKVFSIAALLLVCSISLIALGSSNDYVNKLLYSVKDYSLSKVFFAAGEKDNSQKPLIAERKRQPVKNVRETAEATQNVPDEVVYFILFNHLVGLKNRAEQEAQLTDEPSLNYYDLYEKQANLDASQSRFLFQTAQNCIDAIKPIDEQAKSIIDRAGGQVKSPANIPFPPLELEYLQQQKDDVILNYKNQLGNGLGVEKFAEFNQFARQKIAPQVEIIPTEDLAAEGEAK